MRFVHRAWKRSLKNYGSYVWTPMFWTQKPETCVYIDFLKELVAWMRVAEGGVDIAVYSAAFLHMWLFWSDQRIHRPSKCTAVLYVCGREAELQKLRWHFIHIDLMSEHNVKLNFIHKCSFEHKWHLLRSCTNWEASGSVSLPSGLLDNMFRSDPETLNCSWFSINEWAVKTGKKAKKKK